MTKQGTDLRVYDYITPSLFFVHSYCSFKFMASVFINSHYMHIRAYVYYIYVNIYRYTHTYIIFIFINIYIIIFINTYHTHILIYAYITYTNIYIFIYKPINICIMYVFLSITCSVYTIVLSFPLSGFCHGVTAEIGIVRKNHCPLPGSWGGGLLESGRAWQQLWK